MSNPLIYPPHQPELIKELIECLQWFVDNDDTNEGDEPLEYLQGQTWNDVNAFWLEGLNRARSVLEKLHETSEA
jgi:hypothetical protein